MVENSRVNGLTIIWKGWVCILGRMEEGMKENIKMIRNMDMEYMNGLMADIIRDGGTKGSNMDLACIKCLARNLKMGYGKKGRE